jgi:hypothetical protein
MSTCRLRAEPALVLLLAGALITSVGCSNDPAAPDLRDGSAVTAPPYDGGIAADGGLSGPGVTVDPDDLVIPVDDPRCDPAADLRAE